MENQRFNVLLYDKENVFDIADADNLIRLSGCTLSELMTLTRILDRQEGVSIACYPYLDE